jgi:hypothetical protein
MASSQCRPCQPRPTQGDVDDRELPHGSARGSCRTLRERELRPHPDCLQLLPQPSLPKVPEPAPAKAGGAAAREWLAERETELLPVPYFHVVFSLPAKIADIAYQNKAAIYDILFKASAETMITIAADPKHLGARIGVLSVLHTWGSALNHHPHVHMIVPGGGISLDRERWVACRPDFLLYVGVLSRLFRRLVLEKLTAAHSAGTLQFFSKHAALANARAFAAYWRRCATVTGWFTANDPSADPRKFCATSPAIPTVLPSPTAA